MVNQKFCKTCSTFKPLTDFYKNAKAPDGRAYKCTVCTSSYQKKIYRRTHPVNKREPENQDYELLSPAAAAKQPGEKKDDELVDEIKANIAELAKRWNRTRLDVFRIYLLEEIMRYISGTKPTM